MHLHSTTSIKIASWWPTRPARLWQYCCDSDSIVIIIIIIVSNHSYDSGYTSHAYSVFFEFTISPLWGYSVSTVVIQCMCMPKSILCVIWICLHYSWEKCDMTMVFSGISSQNWLRFRRFNTHSSIIIREWQSWTLLLLTLQVTLTSID